jgi:peptidoglycan/LPS O-acetylase OafA/YrhL
MASIILVAALVAGALLYYVIESPFMALRDRWVPGNFVRRGAIERPARA